MSSGGAVDATSLVEVSDSEDHEESVRLSKLKCPYQYLSSFIQPWLYADLAS